MPFALDWPTPRKGHPSGPLPVPWERYATAADLAASAVPPTLTPEQGATLDGMLAQAGCEVAAALAKRYGCR